jgi:uracil-DNA glycosylase family 4
VTYDPVAHGASCSRCPLRDATPVPPTPAANGKPRLIIIGEGPGSVEVNFGAPFLGPSGRLLNGALREAGFDRKEAHVTNALLCRIENDSDVKEALPCCAPRLANELAQLDPAVPILALGAPATRVTLGKAGIMKARGFVWHTQVIKETQLRGADRRVEKAREALKLKQAPWAKAGLIPKKKAPSRATREKLQSNLTKALDSSALIHARALLAGRVVIPSVHPAFILRGADGWLPVMRVDIRKAAQWAKAPFPLEDEGAFTTTTNIARARHLLKTSGFSDFVNVDIETDGRDPMTVGITCVGIFDVRDAELLMAGKIKRLPKARCLVLDKPGDLDLLPQGMIDLLKGFLKNRRVLTHNGPAFDQIALDRFGIHYSRWEDTLLAHYAFASHLPKSLAHVGSVYCRISPWKSKFKQGSDEKGVAGFGVKAEDLAAYNAADVRIGSLSWVRMQPDLEHERKVYEHDKRTALLSQKMQVNGILVDQERRRDLSRKMKFRAAALMGEMRNLLGNREFHPRRIVDIRRALFEQLKAPTYFAPFTPTGLPAASAAVLEKLKMSKGDAGTLADLIIRYRSANDVRSEYLENVFIGADGRVHPGWRNYGTECMPAGELVLTRRGYVAVEEVCLADEVFTHKARWRRVTAIRSFGPDTIYCVRLANGKSLRTNAAHKFLVVGDRWRPASWLAPGHLVKVHLGQKAFGWAAVVSVSIQCPEVVYGLTVEEDRSHVTGGIVTHNTGRPAARDPNILNTPCMQNCPGCGRMLIDGMTHAETCKPRKRKQPQPEDQIRDVYIAAPGHVFVYFDLSQAEMRFAANISGDEAFIASCGKDVHAGNAKVIFAGIPGAVEALEKDLKGAGKVFRDIAKNIGFAISYLAEAPKLFMHLIEHGFNVDLAQCEEIISRIHSTYWRYYQFVDENVRLCKKQGFLRTPFLGRKRWLGYYPKPTTVSNLPIQAGVADVMNDRLVVLDDRKDPACKQILYAYDAGVYECPENRADAMEKLITEVWAEPVRLLDGRTFLQPIDLKRGTRWSDFG